MKGRAGEHERQCLGSQVDLQACSPLLHFLIRTLPPIHLWRPPLLLLNALLLLQQPLKPLLHVRGWDWEVRTRLTGMPASHYSLFLHHRESLPVCPKWPNGQVLFLQHSFVNRRGNVKNCYSLILALLLLLIRRNDQGMRGMEIWEVEWILLTWSCRVHSPQSVQSKHELPDAGVNVITGEWWKTELQLWDVAG